MKKILSVFALTVLLGAAIASCRKNDDGEVAGAMQVIVSPAEKNVQRGEVFTLSATVLPADVPDRSVVWSSLNPEMASVTADGSVKTIRPGVTYIVATSADGAAKGACMVTINYPGRYYVVLKDASGTDLPAAVYGYPTMTSRFTAESSDGASHSFMWTCSSADAAEVDGDGHVTFALPSEGREGYLYYASAILKVESEDTYSDKVEIVSNVRDSYSFGGGSRSFDDDYGVSRGKSYEVALQWFDGRKDAELPASLYTVSSSDESAFKVERSGDVYKVTSSSSVGACARLTARLWNGTELVLGRYTVSDAVSGDISDYIEDMR